MENRFDVIQQKHNLMSPRKKMFLTLMLTTQQKIKATSQVCNGAVVKEIGKSLVKICTDGKIKLKPRKQVPVVFLLHSYPAR